MVRLVPLVLGGLAVAAGAMLTALGGDPLPTKWLQDVALLGTTMLVAGAAVFGLLVRALYAGDDPRLGADEFGPDVRTPGDAVDERVANARDGATRADVRDRFADAAVATLVRERGCSPKEAREMLETGAWTDDAEAAAFFADESSGGSLGEWIRAVLTGRSRFQRRAERASSALFDDGPGKEGGR